MRPSFYGERGLWARYREHLLGIDGSRPMAATTVTTYRKHCWAFVAFLGERSWWKARPRDLAAFIGRPAPESRTGTRAANTALQVAVAIRGLYRFAYLHSYTPTDRMAAFVPPRGGQPRPRGYDQAELRVIIEGAAYDPRLHLLCWLGYGGGLRCVEMSRLRAEQVDLRHGIMEVLGKGNKLRPVPIVVPGLRAALRHELAGRPAAGPLICSSLPPYGPLSPQTISMYLARHIQSQPDPHRPGKCLEGSAHDLRHSLVWWLLEHGGEQYLKTISLLIGHADTGVTERTYTLRYMGRAKEVLAKLPDPTAPKRVAP